MTKEIYVSVDVEADGPIPGPYSMLSLGMSVVGRPELTFYAELKPISNAYIQEAMDVNKLDREKLKVEGSDPEVAMAAAASFLHTIEENDAKVDGEPRRCVFLAAPAVWDGMFVHWYFIKFLGRNPFGVTGSGIDMRSYWMGAQYTNWNNTSKRDILKKIKVKKLDHTHRADDDAKEQAAYFQGILEFQERTRFLTQQSLKELVLSQAAQRNSSGLLERQKKQLDKYQNRVFVGVAAVVRREGKIILGKRKGAHGAGSWSFPGGGQEKHETDRQAVARELAEETRIILAEDKFRFLVGGESWHEDYQSRWRTLFFETTVGPGVEPELAEPDKCEEWIWVSPTELPSPLFGAVQSLVDSKLL